MTLASPWNQLPPGVSVRATRETTWNIPTDQMPRFLRSVANSATLAAFIRDDLSDERRVELLDFAERTEQKARAYQAG